MADNSPARFAASTRARGAREPSMMPSTWVDKYVLCLKEGRYQYNGHVHMKQETTSIEKKKLQSKTKT